MPQIASKVSYQEFLNAGVTAEEVLALIARTDSLTGGAKDATLRDVFGATNRTAWWNMQNALRNVVAAGGVPSIVIPMTGTLTVDKVRDAVQTYVRDGAALPQVAAVDNGSGNAPAPSTSNAPAPVSPSGEPAQGVSPNLIDALTSLYGDQEFTFDHVATGNDFRMMLWGIAPEELKADAERGLIGDALNTLTKSADASLTVRQILRAAGLDDSAVIAAMRETDPFLVTSQHAKAADSLFHLSHIAAQLNDAKGAYEGMVTDAATKIVRQARSRSAPTDTQVAEARNEVAIDTLGALLDALERESARWSEYHENRRAQSEREKIAAGPATPALAPIAYDSLPEAFRATVNQTMWDLIAPDKQAAALVALEAEAAAAPAPDAAPETETVPETETPAPAAPEGRRSRSK